MVFIFEIAVQAVQAAAFSSMLLATTLEAGVGLLKTYIDGWKMYNDKSQHLMSVGLYDFQGKCEDQWSSRF